jgi:hypothetical protein
LTDRVGFPVGGDGPIFASAIHNASELPDGVTALAAHPDAKRLRAEDPDARERGGDVDEKCADPAEPALRFAVTDVPRALDRLLARRP